MKNKKYYKTLQNNIIDSSRAAKELINDEGKRPKQQLLIIDD